MAGEASLRTAPRGSGASNRYTFHRDLSDVGCLHDEREKNTLQLSHAYVTAALDAFTRNDAFQRDVSDRAVAVCAVVPVNEPGPQRCQGEVGKG